MEPELGSVFDGRYVVRRVVAEAEHGAVYAADHRFMERTVAIHLAAKDADASERLEREARLLDRARGPRVLSLLDVGEAGEGRRFLISEPVLGRSLDGVLAVRGALTRPEVIALGLDIAQALEAAHEVGVVHQGLSPASILCVDAPAANTVARLLDFGVWPSPLGMFGGSLGAMAYAAPERFLREQPDAASDIHALGAILYETAVGELPPRDQRTESALRKSLDADLAQVIARALDEVDRRYRSMAEIIEALEVAGATGSVVTSKVVTIGSVPPPRRPSRPDLALPDLDRLDRPMTFSDAAPRPELNATLDRLPRLRTPDLGDLDDPLDSAYPSAPPRMTHPDLGRLEDLDPYDESVDPGAPAATAATNESFDDRRAFPRVGFVTPVRVRLADRNTMDGRSHAIGEGGMLLLIQQTLDDDEEVSLRFSLPTTGRVVTVPAVVRWVNDTPNRRAVGVRFLEPREDVIADIREYVRLMGGG